MISLAQMAENIRNLLVVVGQINARLKRLEDHLNDEIIAKERESLELFRRYMEENPFPVMTQEELEELAVADFCVKCGAYVDAHYTYDPDGTVRLRCPLRLVSEDRPI